MENNTEILKQIEIENFIWLIYLGIIALSNYLEKKYYTENNLIAKEEYRRLNIIIFTIALCIYIYFFNDTDTQVRNLKITDSSRKIFFTEMNRVATALILIAGVILLLIAIYDTDLETEIAFS